VSADRAAGERTWRDPDWHAQALAWVDDVLVDAGRRVVGPVEQPHLRPWSTILKIPTDEGLVWFKAAGPGTAYEVALYGPLARWASPYVLTPLALDIDRSWLLLPDGGARLRDRVEGGPGIDHWLRILPEYADLQRRLEPRVADLLHLGVPDLRPSSMPARLAALIEEPTVGLTDAHRDRLRALEPSYAERCSWLAASGVGPTIQHDDLHDGNVFVGEAGDRIFDWGDAVVAHPFGTLLATLRSIASRAGEGRDPATQARLVDAYLEPWTDRHSRAELDATVVAAIRVATVGRALAWQRALAGVPPHRHGDYAGAVADWLLELSEPNLI
jgi:hypothetical protein